MTSIRAQGQMVQRWLRRQGYGDESGPALARLASLDALVMQLAAEVVAREEPDPPDTAQDPRDEAIPG